MRSIIEIYKSDQDYSGSVERKNAPQYLSREATYIVVPHQSIVKELSEKL